ncbi:hypothetical protein GOP47_0011596 [Adiantum capillus-veneris]|uniref:Long-chain-alcohol oxidase n=1 Tax=Adiantum capillus-veneris TaxID=13818 RepID=A0A9D4ZFJ8_ADICA|nr:hypothetical protein GOP47_0011596 [Adiantum capillus-veneris]
MEVIEALCETIFPSVSLEEFFESFPGHDKELPKAELQALETYLLHSAKDGNLPLQVAGFLTQVMPFSELRLVHLSLWALSTRVGTLVLGGKHAITKTFPFCKRLYPLDRDIWLYPHGQHQTLPTPKKSASSLGSRVIDAAQVGSQLATELNNRGFPLIDDDDVAHLKALRRSQSFKKTSDLDIGVKCEVVVVGSGAGGSVVAAKLAQAGHSVLILEKGHYFPAAELSQLEGPSMNAMYENGGCLLTKDSSMILLAGTTVGGGSTVNWGASFQTPSHVRKEWAETLHLDLFASNAYDNAMDEVCSRLGVQSEVVHENFQNGVLRAGCQALGFHVENIPRNSPPDHQCGFCGLGCKQEKKQNAMLTWLEDAAAAEAVVLASCKAEEVLCAKREGQHPVAVGVVAQVESGNTCTTLYVEANVVVVACGALWTPLLLKRSGLLNHEIGQNLHIHPVQLVWGHFEEGRGADGVSYRGGIMTAYSKVAANWDTTGYGSVIQCVASQPGIMSVCLPWVSGVDFKARMRKFSRTAIFIVLTRDHSGGQVRVDEDGCLSVYYQLSDADKRNSNDGVEKGLKILAAAGASEVGSGNVDGETFAPCSGTKADFEEYSARVRANTFKQVGTTVVSAHQMGSCRMGMCPLISAVQPNGETWEVKGLFVADSSVLPTALGINPMITVQSIALCTADNILFQLQHG